ncbi:hypothetical protein [Pseudomonas sp. I2]|uniref:hypothetical protein n=1 Tax=Pseudomonas sp. I2 TaxID=1338438 RepID=UPI0034D3D8B4
MRRQRGMVLLVGLLLSLLLGLLSASALHDALIQARLGGLLLANARALEQAEAALLEGAARLLLAPPAPCQAACLPPPDAHDVQGGDLSWQRTENGFFLLQNLGESALAAQVPEGVQVTLYRVTAVSRERQARHVLEAVYALQADQAVAPRRLLWRQRLRRQ